MLSRSLRVGTTTLSSGCEIRVTDDIPPSKTKQRYAK
jgi:hypothetical protein